MKKRELADQSEFSQDQEILQMPPEETEKRSRVPSKRKRWIIWGGLALVLVVGLAWALQPTPSTPDPSPTPLPSATPNTEPTLLDEELVDLEEAVEDAAPENEALLPPTVDMEIEI